jgi:hypothetical protein
MNFDQAGVKELLEELRKSDLLDQSNVVYLKEVSSGKAKKDIATFQADGALPTLRLTED